ncbi:FAD/NAD(P)-binding protein [Anaerolineales bacterium HSG6]|nr:FAD/NAD(P)-binding protein [Anaerolineales bacterium HSG6]MDM8530815.1 FAD/NAD(P)-binding protein [Anaerolineales bacterium HSG25]
MITPNDPMIPQQYRIRQRQQDNADTFTLELEPTNGTVLQFAPGQFNMLYVFGVGEIPISISGNPATPSKLVHTTRSVGTVTNAMSTLKTGDVIGVRGPYGKSWPVMQSTGRDVVIVAGGIGLAPLRPAIYQLFAKREQFGKLVLLYGTRTQEDILYRQELEQWRARFDVDVYVTVDRATSDWRGNVGVVTNLIPRTPFYPPDTVAMVCGPEVMMRFTVQALQKRGVPTEQIYVSMERNMKCATGFCGHCQFGSTFICKDGPVFSYDQVESFIGMWEV